MFSLGTLNIKMGLTKAKPSEIIRRVLYYFICGILLFSGITKIIDPTLFIETLKAVFKISEDLILVFATLLPIIEIGLGLMMLFKIRQKETLIAVAILFFCFLGFSIYGTVIGLNNDCGCFGKVVGSSFGIWMVIRNFLFVSLSIIVFIKFKN
jgi:hypothetical protein